MEMTMTRKKEFPEIIRKNTGVREEFLFWLRQIGKGGVENDKLMLANEDGYAEVSMESEVEVKGEIPVYRLLFGEISLIHVGEFA